MDKFLLLFLRYYDQDPQKIRSLLDPKPELWVRVPEPISSGRVDIDWSRVSGDRSVKGSTKVYTVKQLQEIALQLGINPNGLKKNQLATEIFKHKPLFGPQIPLLIVPVSTPVDSKPPEIRSDDKSLWNNLYKAVFG